MSDALKTMVVVTGGSGFLGQNVIKYLASCGFGGVILDIKKPTDPQLIDILNSGSWKFYECDFSSAKSLCVFKSPAEPFYLIHLAGIVTTTNALTTTVVSEVQTQVNGVFTLLNHLGSALKGVALTSTIETYGFPETLPINETHPTDPFNIYGTVKLTLEYFLNIYCKSSRRPLAILRLPQIYGPGDTYAKAIPTFIKNCLQGKPSSIVNEGSDIREFVHVNDVGLALSLSISKMANGIFNITGGCPVSIAETLKLVQGICGSDITAENRSSNKQQLGYSFDLSKSRRELGYAPTVKFEDGLKSEVQWLKGCLA